MNQLLGVDSCKLDDKYTLELADGKLIELGEIVPGWILMLEGHLFEIDLPPVELESFDTIVGMDWLSRNRVETIFFDKLVQLSLNTISEEERGDLYLASGNHCDRQWVLVLI